VTAITEKLAVLRQRIDAAARGAQRLAGDVTILAVSKTQPVEAIGAAHGAGLTDFGENYAQEAVPKITQLASGAADGLRWHFIGGIQANKTRLLAENFHWVQTVSNAQIAGRLSRQRPYYAGDLQVCLQVRPEPATHRAGVAAAEAPALARAIADLPRLRLRGLMFMPLPGLGPDRLRAEFRRVRALFEELRSAGHDLDTLSMGMSDDLELAVAEGSTMVRIGTALFGRRN
jgi:hypothetical protein